MMIANMMSRFENVLIPSTINMLAYVTLQIPKMSITESDRIRVKEEIELSFK